MTKSKLKKYLELNPDINSKELLDYLNTTIITNYRYFVEHTLQNKRHRIDGPAAENLNGDKLWYKHGKLHRTDGPAKEYTSGTKEWWLNGKLHRTDGPAAMNANGTKGWYKHGKRHREDGPAVIYPDSEEEWWINGEEVDSNFRPLK